MKKRQQQRRRRKNRKANDQKTGNEAGSISIKSRKPSEKKITANHEPPGREDSKVEKKGQRK